MKKKHIHRGSFVLLTCLLVSMAFMPHVSASEVESPDSQMKYYAANTAQIEVANQLWGQDISMGEYYEAVMPDFLAGMPEDVRAHLYTVKKVWPTPSTVGESSQKVVSGRSTLSETFQKIRATLDADPEGFPFDIITYHESAIGAQSRSVTFRSETWVAWPLYYKLPHIGIVSTLYKWDGTMGHLVSAAGTGGYSVDNMKAVKTTTVSQAGDYYAGGEHIVQYPVGYEPPEYTYGTTSDLLWVA